MVTKYKTFISPSIAGNVDFTFSPGKGLKHKLIYGKITITTDATVANRTAKLWYRDKDNVIISHAITHSTAVTASQTRDIGLITYEFGVGDTTDLGISWGVGNQIACIPILHYVYETDKFYIDLANGVAGDSYTVTLKYLEAPINEDFHP